MRYHASDTLVAELATRRDRTMSIEEIAAAVKRTPTQVWASLRRQGIDYHYEQHITSTWLEKGPKSVAQLRKNLLAAGFATPKFVVDHPWTRPAAAPEPPRAFTAASFRGR
jgi:hypothetical protein